MTGDSPGATADDSGAAEEDHLVGTGEPRLDRKLTGPSCGLDWSVGEAWEESVRLRGGHSELRGRGRGSEGCCRGRSVTVIRE